MKDLKKNRKDFKKTKTLRKLSLIGCTLRDSLSENVTNE